MEDFTSSARAGSLWGEGRLSQGESGERERERETDRQREREREREEKETPLTLLVGM
jgi:hypothetical protein